MKVEMIILLTKMKIPLSYFVHSRRRVSPSHTRPTLYTPLYYVRQLSGLWMYHCTIFQVNSHLECFKWSFERNYPVSNLNRSCSDWVMRLVVWHENEKYRMLLSIITVKTNIDMHTLYLHSSDQLSTTIILKASVNTHSIRKHKISNSYFLNFRVFMWPLVCHA